MRRAVPILVIIIIIAVVAVAGWLIFKPDKKEAGAQLDGKDIFEPVNQIPVDERPFNLIFPREDGREAKLVISQYQDARIVEYELEYLSGTLPRGGGGEINFTEEELPVERRILFGTCSAGGKCSYHENVNGGTLTLRYLNGQSTKLKSEWNLQQMRNTQGKFTSRDAKFTFDVGERGLSANTYVIVMQTMGLPGEVESEIIGGPYSVTMAKGINLNSQEIQLSMRLNKDSQKIKLLGWVNEGWKEYESKINDKILTSTVDSTTTFVAIATE